MTEENNVEQNVDENVDKKLDESVDYDANPKVDDFEVYEEEKNRIREQRELSKVKEGTLRYRIFLENDQVRNDILKIKSQLDNLMIDMEDMALSIKRHESEFEGGLITTKLKNDLVMVPEELEVLIKREKWSLVNSIPLVRNQLLALAKYVNTRNLTNEYDLLTEIQYNNVVREIELKLLNLGFDLFTLTSPKGDSNSD